MSSNFRLYNSDGEDDLVCNNNYLLATGTNITSVIFGEDDGDDISTKIDHQRLERGPRTGFDHGEALACITRDYLAPIPNFFQKIMEDVENADINVNEFYM